jgi:hypothetical protein
LPSAAKSGAHSGSTIQRLFAAGFCLAFRREERRAPLLDERVEPCAVEQRVRQVPWPAPGSLRGHRVYAAKSSSSFGRTMGSPRSAAHRASNPAASSSSFSFS